MANDTEINGMLHILFLARAGFLSGPWIYYILPPFLLVHAMHIQVSQENYNTKRRTINLMAIKIWSLTKSLNILSYCSWL